MLLSSILNKCVFPNLKAATVDVSMSMNYYYCCTYKSYHGTIDELLWVTLCLVCIHPTSHGTIMIRMVRVRPLFTISGNSSRTAGGRVLLATALRVYGLRGCAICRSVFRGAFAWRLACECVCRMYSSVVPVGLKGSANPETTQLQNSQAQARYYCVGQAQAPGRPGPPPLLSSVIYLLNMI